MGLWTETDIFQSKVDDNENPKTIDLDQFAQKDIKIRETKGEKERERDLQAYRGKS